MSKVFISYGSRNRKVAESLCSLLEAHGIPCWMAPRDISSGYYAGEITRAIKSADVFVVICSKETRESDHVKNEVNLAASHSGLMLPYCLDDNSFDDVLEYYLGSKQRIIYSGKQEEDFLRIERIIREHRKEEVSLPVNEPKPKRLPWRVVAPILLALAILVGLFFFYRDRSKSVVERPIIDSAEIIDTLVPPTISQTDSGKPVVESITHVTTEVVANPSANTFDGKLIDGYPDGWGILRFKSSRLIDAHDPKGRIAEPGDYIDGRWTRGHLNKGTWYGSDGMKKDFILLGDNQDVDPDQKLGKCVKP